MFVKGNKPKDIEAKELRGRVDAVIMKNEENGFAILKVKAQGEAAHVSVKGPLAHVNVGEEVTCKGRWKADEKYGWGFQVTDVSVEQPLTKTGLIAYLQNTIPGVGPVLAKKIVQEWGEGAIKVMDEDPRRLLEIKGVQSSKMDEIIQAWEDKKGLRDVMLFLNTHEVSANKAARLYQAYGKETLEILKDDPYRITELRMIGFKTADEIAVHIGYPLEGEARIDAGINFILEQGEERGNVYMELSSVLKAATKDLGIRNTELVRDRIRELAADGIIILDKEESQKPRVYSRELYEVEGEVAKRVLGLVRSAPSLEKVDIPALRRKLLEDNLTSEQWQAVTNAFQRRISILTGGPGVGKTYATRTLLELADMAGIRYELAAPTGKAAKRLSEVTGRQAKTIHRLLKWLPFEKHFFHDEQNPLVSELLLVDETSMVDVRLARSLLAALGPQQHIVFIGDKDQLPSVGAGKFLDDLLEVREMPITKLTKIFRQAAKSLIIQNSRRINRGEFPYGQDSHVDGVEDSELLKDFFFVPRNDDAAILRTTVDFVVNRIPRWKNYDPIRDIQVYAPMRGGAVGLDKLNDTLQWKLNEKGEKIRYKNFRVGDKIIQTKNNYDFDLMNGETAIIKSIDREASKATLETMDGIVIKDMPYDELWSFMLAYAISIHRSQGSQSPAVVIPLSTSHYVMLRRNLLYTAVTRAEDLCVLVGQSRAVSTAVGRVDTVKRCTGLSGRVNSALLGNPEPRIPALVSRKPEKKTLLTEDGEKTGRKTSPHREVSAVVEPEIHSEPVVDDDPGFAIEDDTSYSDYEEWND